MKLTFTPQPINQVDAALFIIPVKEGGKNRPLAFLNKQTRGVLDAVAKQEGFRGQTDRTLVWQGTLFNADRKVILVGAGKEISTADFRTAVGRGVRYAYGHNIAKVGLFFDARDFGPVENPAGWASEALVMSDYKYLGYKSKARKKAYPKEVAVGALPKADEAGAAARSFKLGKARGQAVLLARDLVNEPANMLSPADLATRAEGIANQKGLEIKIMNERAIRQKKMGLLLSVAAGSDRPPRFIHLTYRPKGKPTRKIVLVGKGVTFDSGGLCIKPGKSMYEMKTDMAGAAAVLAIMSELKTLGVRAEVHGIVPTTDNAINGNATRPGDVFTGMSGKTVEVLNTDAEGRLILADALAYAGGLEPDIMVDMATLTGACEVALGSFAAGLFAKYDQDANELLKAAETAGELVWRLPLSKELSSSLKSEVADIKNIGSRFGGAITAALFLQHFTGELPWAHLDIAGPARLDKSTPVCPKGGSGFGVLTAFAYLEGLA